MQIKTLAEILAETLVESDDVKSPSAKSKNKPSVRQGRLTQTRNTTTSRGVKPIPRDAFVSDISTSDPDSQQIINTHSDDKHSYKKSNRSTNKRKKKRSSFHPAAPYQPKTHQPKTATPVSNNEPDEPTLKSILAEIAHGSAQSDDALPASSSQSTSISQNTSTSQSSIDNLPDTLKAYLKTPEQRQAEVEDIKANSRLRWLAFYYLSRREHSAGELKQKLLDKDQDPDKIDALIKEFQQKGYQSDYRTALMLIREGIRKRRGRVRIKQDFYKRKVDMPSNIDELIDMAMADNEAFVDVVSDEALVEGVDWLKLAVEARVKKYGDAPPTEAKDKAKQLRFLQYRGFKPEVCFEAIKHDLDSLAERF